MDETIVQDCRGIIVDESNDWYMAMDFRKFFNLCEPHAAEIDWSTATVHEKVGSSLCGMYAYDSKWQVANTGQGWHGIS